MRSHEYATTADALKVPPFFKRLGCDGIGPSDAHGTSGPITISRYLESEFVPIQRAFYDACRLAGFNHAGDHNAVGVSGRRGNREQPLFAAGALRANWRLAAIATMLIAGVYAAYRINAATPGAIGVASQPIGAGEHNAPTAASAVPLAVESKPVEPETTAALQAPIPTTNLEAPKRASTRQRPVPVPATKHASVRQRQAPAGPTPPMTQTLAAAPVGAPVAETRKARQPDPWQAMHASLARCGGDLIARIVCDQRVRRRFCEGHWGEAPECGSSVANDHGQ